jgi:tetratricopeptide (TPR) repeat protein
MLRGANMMQDPLPAEEPALRSASRTRSPAVAVLFALVAIIAIATAIYFWRGQQAIAIQLAAARTQAIEGEQNFNVSKGTIDTVVSDLADSLAKPAGIQAQEIAPILVKVEEAIGKLVAQTNNDPTARRSQAGMYVHFSATYLALGNTKLAVDSARKGVDIFRAIAAAEPNNHDMQSNVGLSLQKLGEALRASGDYKGALAADRESLDIARILADKEPGNKQFRTDLVLALWRLAAAGDDPRARLTEALKILNNLDLAAMLTPAQENWIGMIRSELSKL